MGDFPIQGKKRLARKSPGSVLPATEAFPECDPYLQRSLTVRFLLLRVNAGNTKIKLIEEKLAMLQKP